MKEAEKRESFGESPSSVLVTEFELLVITELLET